MIAVTRKIRLVRRPDRRLAIVAAPDEQESAPAARVPRISRLMALAIHFDRLIREGKVTDQSDLARLAHVTQPRMTQVMNLNLLAPEIQEALLFLEPTEQGREPLHERLLRPIAASPQWHAQRKRWRWITARITTPDRQPT